MYYTQEQIDRANQTDLVSFLQSQGEQLTRAGQEYRWKRHDSLTIRGNKWYRHSQCKGGAPIDFVMEFFGKSFTEAIELLTGEKGAAPPPDRPSPAPISDFRLPPRSPDNRIARNYLTAARRIDEDVTGFFLCPRRYLRGRSPPQRRICGAGRGRNTALRPQQGNGGKLPARCERQRQSL